MQNYVIEPAKASVLSKPKGRQQTCPAYCYRATSPLYPSHPLSLRAGNGSSCPTADFVVRVQRRVEHILEDRAGRTRSLRTRT
jgi:hypothetical protein